MKVSQNFLVGFLTVSVAAITMVAMTVAHFVIPAPKRGLTPRFYDDGTTVTSEARIATQLVDLDNFLELYRDDVVHMIRFCSEIDDFMRAACFSRIGGAVGQYLPVEMDLEAVCAAVPHEYEADCLEAATDTKTSSIPAM